MSWSRTTTGTQEEIKQQVGADAHIPPAVENAIGTALSLLDSDKPVTLTTYGHIGDTKTGNLTITISNEQPGK